MSVHLHEYMIYACKSISQLFQLQAEHLYKHDNYHSNSTYFYVSCSTNIVDVGVGLVLKLLVLAIETVHFSPEGTVHEVEV